MKFFTTVFKAIEVESDTLKTYEGERICADTMEEAERYCRVFRPWLRVEGELISEYLSNRYIDYDDTPPVEL